MTSKTSKRESASKLEEISSESDDFTCNDDHSQHDIDEFYQEINQNKVETMIDLY